MGLGQSLDQAVQSQPSQLVAHAPRRDVVGSLAEQDGKLLTQVLVGKPMPHIPHIEFVNRTEFPPNGGRLFQVLPA